MTKSNPPLDIYYMYTLITTRFRIVEKVLDAAKVLIVYREH